jgi:pimeloyl-ACP methyl ester carboxylesterase
VLAIQGEDDPYGTLRQVEEIAPTLGLLRTVVIPGCGHAPHREQPLRTNEAILDFLKTLGLSSRAG